MTAISIAANSSTSSPRNASTALSAMFEGKVPPLADPSNTMLPTTA